MYLRGQGSIPRPIGTCTGDEIICFVLGHSGGGVRRFEWSVTSDIMVYVALSRWHAIVVSLYAARVYGSREAKRVPYPRAILPRAPFAQARALPLTPYRNYPSA